jgi:hypothetical protein
MEYRFNDELIMAGFESFGFLYIYQRGTTGWYGPEVVLCRHSSGGLLPAPVWVQIRTPGG